MRTLLALVLTLAACGHDGPAPICLEPGDYLCKQAVTFWDCPGQLPPAPADFISAAGETDCGSKPPVFTSDDLPNGCHTNCKTKLDVTSTRSLTGYTSCAIDCTDLGAGSCSYTINVYCKPTE